MIIMIKVHGDCHWFLRYYRRRRRRRVINGPEKQVFKIIFRQTLAVPFKCVIVVFLTHAHTHALRIRLLA